MRNIFLINNHKNAFGNKYKASIYHSGMDKDKLTDYFNSFGYKCIFLTPSSINFSNVNKNDIYLYTSTEDHNLIYKSYVEDIVLGLESSGAKVIPKYIYLRSHHNKVFMEILRDLNNNSKLKNINSNHFGTFEDFKQNYHYKSNNVVIKKASGASSYGVYLAKNYSELVKYVKKASKSKFFFKDLKEIIRKIKHKNYLKISNHRNKFIIQNFIPNLDKDYKILIYFDKYYIFQRPTRKNDFRASGSGKEKYLFGSDCDIPVGIFDFAKEIFDSFDSPILSLDIAHANNQFYILEFQFTAFGTVGQQKSKDFFVFKNNMWISQLNKFDLEFVYAESMTNYIKSNESK